MLHNHQNAVGSMILSIAFSVIWIESSCVAQFNILTDVTVIPMVCVSVGIVIVQHATEDDDVDRNIASTIIIIIIIMLIVVIVT